jgi:hypothetical protein
MNTKKTFKNQELFSFCFQGQTQKNKWQFIIALKENFKEDTAGMLLEDKGNKLNIDEFAEFQLNIDVGINMFYFCFIKVMSYDHRRKFLEWQYEQCEPEAKLSFLYRVESLSTANYWYSFGENSHYDAEVENVVLEWVLEKFSGKSKLKLII